MNKEYVLQYEVKVMMLTYKCKVIQKKKMEKSLQKKYLNQKFNTNSRAVEMIQY